MTDASVFKTRVEFDKDARAKLFVGLEKAANAIGSTLGPKGKLVIISKPGEQPIVTKDGVTVSRAINLKDPLARMGAELVKEAASQTNDAAGDGTTTATVLTHALVKEGLKLIDAGSDAIEVKKGMATAIQIVLSNLRASANQLTTKDELANVAMISANGDRELGDLVANALSSVGKDGIVTAEDAKGTTTSLQRMEGMLVERGYLSPYFVTDSDKMHAKHDGARVLVVDGKLSSIKALVSVLEKINSARQPLLVIADEVEGEALQGLVVNKLNAGLRVVAIKAPGYGNLKENLLQDIAIFCSAKIVGAKTGLSLEKVQLSDLGVLKRVIVDAKSATLVADKTSEAAIHDRSQELSSQLEDVTLSPEDAGKLRIRLARLSSGAAVIRVGGATEIEMIERKHRIEDALNATRAAAEEGIVPGGGYALFKASLNVIKDAFEEPSQDVRAGMLAVVAACSAPIRRILSNAGVSADVVLHQMVERGKGYDARAGEHADLLERGIIDPVKVTRHALQNAHSVAAVFLSLDAAIVEDE